MAIETAVVGTLELILQSGDNNEDGVFPTAWGRNMPMAQYRETDGSLVWLYADSARLPDILQFLRENPRPAHRETYPRVEVYNDEAYWSGKRPVTVLINVSLLEVLEALREFAPE